MALLRYEPIQIGQSQMLQEHPTDRPVCGCGAMLAAKPLGRRRVLGLTLAAVGAGLALPGLASAAEPGKRYKAMLLTCIDPRFVTAARKVMADKKWLDNYSQFSFAGAAVGVVADRFQSWHDTFWDNLAITIQLHKIENVVALDHRDCGAAELAYGKEAVATPQAETETHRKALAEFRNQVAQRHPQLRVITGLLPLKGSLTVFS